MAFRLKLVPDNTRINFFRWQMLTFGISAVAMLASIIVIAVNGFNFGIDFKGGTTIRTESPTAFQVGDYRQALSGLGLADVTITEVFDPSFGSDKHVAQIRIGATDDTGSASLGPFAITVAAATSGGGTTPAAQVRASSGWMPAIVSAYFSRSSPAFL